MEHLMSEFFWQGNSKDKNIHLVAWAIVCSDINLGGLGIRPLRTMNTALLGKLVWRIYIDHKSLWSVALRSKYLDSAQAERIFIVANYPVGSMLWNGLRKVIP